MEPAADSAKQAEGKRPLERVTSYNNRYRSPSTEVAAPCPLTPDPVPDPGAAKLQSERRLSVQSRRSAFQRLVSVTSADGHPDLTRATSVDSAPDDVFVDMSGVPARPPLSQTLSFASTASATALVVPNPHTRLTHSVHDCFWCCSCLYFAFFCCLPAVRLMERSDTAFASGQDSKARSLGRLSTAMLVVGTVLTLVLFAGLLFLVIYFTAFHQ